jgi:hypothetical protein
VKPVQEIIVIDFEASSLPQPGSFPIEVAVGFVDASVLSWRIKPTDAWLATGVWDPGAERRHGISKDDLIREGVDVTIVVERLADMINDRPLLSDCPDVDGFWWRVLFEAAGRPVPDGPTSLHDYLLSMTMTGSGPAAEEEVRAAVDEARRRYPAEHSAYEDARRNIEAVRILAELSVQEDDTPPDEDDGPLDEVP